MRSPREKFQNQYLHLGVSWVNPLVPQSPLDLGEAHSPHLLIPRTMTNFHGLFFGGSKMQLCSYNRSWMYVCVSCNSIANLRVRESLLTRPPTSHLPLQSDKGSAPSSKLNFGREKNREGRGNLWPPGRSGNLAEAHP